MLSLKEAIIASFFIIAGGIYFSIINKVSEGFFILNTIKGKTRVKKVIALIKKLAIIASFKLSIDVPP
jgi:hypothetical protein